MESDWALNAYRLGLIGWAPFPFLWEPRPFLCGRYEARRAICNRGYKDGDRTYFNVVRLPLDEEETYVTEAGSPWSLDNFPYGRLIIDTPEWPP